jgi:hypothetical protein
MGREASVKAPLGDDHVGVIREVVDELVEVRSTGGGADGKCQSPSRIGGEVGYCWGC